MQSDKYQVMQTLFPAKPDLESKVIKALKEREAPSSLLMRHKYMRLKTGTALFHAVVSVATYNGSVICSLQDSRSHWWYISSCLLLLCIDLYFGGLDPFLYLWVMTVIWSTYIKVSNALTNCSPFLAPAALCAHYISLLSLAEAFTITCVLALLYRRGWNLRMFWKKEELRNEAHLREKLREKRFKEDSCIIVICTK